MTSCHQFKKMNDRIEALKQRIKTMNQKIKALIIKNNIIKTLSSNDSAESFKFKSSI